MHEELVELRKRFRRDFPFYARRALTIRTKKGELSPLVLNEAQKRLQSAIDIQANAGDPIRIIILKARQQGLSTHVGGYLFFQVSQRQAAKALVVAHKSDSTSALFDMTRRFYANCPDILKPKTKYSNKRELVFSELDSSYVVATAGGDDIARGETITHLHASELAFWSPSTAHENFNAISQAVPEVPGTAIFIESTANGVSGLFYEQWQAAVRGESGFIPVFIPWFLDPEYRSEVPEGFERTPEEIELVALYDLDDAQLSWRRTKIARNGAELFKQEYPATPDEAFLTSGRPVFHPEIVAEKLREAAEPIERLTLEGTEWLEHPLGELAVYIPLDPKETYVIGADVGKGVRHGDYSCAQILDSKRRQVAVWRGHVVSDYFGHILDALGRYYNYAHLIVENNDHGILTCHVLAKETFYPTLYQQVQHDKVTDKETVTIGFTTNVKTKPMVIDLLRADLRDGAIGIVDRITLEEMRTYIFTESGKMEAETDCYDDTVIALALANYIWTGSVEIIVNKDSYYREAI